MYERALDQPVDPSLASSKHILLAPSFRYEPGLWIRSRVPTTLRQPLLGLQLYQWLGLAAMVAIAIVCQWLAAKVAYPLIVWFFHIGAAETDRTVIRHRLGALRLLVFLVVLYSLLQWLDLPALLAEPIYTAEKIFLTIALVYAGFQWTDLGYLFYDRSRQLDRHRDLGDLIAPFTRRMVKLGVLLVGATYLVYKFGEGDSLTRFLTGLGVAGLAVSLAAQDTLKNLFATIALISDGAFRVGDRIMLGNQEGVIEQLGFRSTKLRTPDDSVLIVPNSTLAAGSIDNLRLHRRIRLLFSLSVGAPLDRLTQLRDELREFLTTYPGVIADRVEVHINRFAEGGIELEASAHYEAKYHQSEKQCRDDLSCEVLRRARALQLELVARKA
jgi:MscS family membrane protein